MRRSKNKHNGNGLMILLLFGVFSVSVLGVLLSGAGVYRQLSRRDEHAYAQRTAAQYVTMRLRQSSGKVSVVPFGDGETLELWEQIGGETYVTRVYYSNGGVWELFCRTDAQVDPQDGQVVLPAEAMHFQLEDDLLTIRLINTDGEEMDLILALRGKEEAE